VPRLRHENRPHVSGEENEQDEDAAVTDGRYGKRQVERAPHFGWVPSASSDTLANPALLTSPSVSISHA
jgi:hypothetical protein